MYCRGEAIGDRGSKTVEGRSSDGIYALGDLWKMKKQREKNNEKRTTRKEQRENNNEKITTHE